MRCGCRPGANRSWKCCAASRGPEFPSRFDPSISKSITADFRGGDLQQALDTLLQPYGYVLIWDVLQGPLGPLPRLGEIQVFIPGEKKKIAPLPTTDEKFEITTGPAGGARRFVKDEVLISFKVGTKRGEVEMLLAQLGGMVVGSIPELGIYRVRFAPGTNIPALVEQLADNPIVSRVEPNYVAEMPPGTVLAAAAAGRLLHPFAAPAAPPMAILDSGLGAGADLGDLVVGRFDALNPDRAPGRSGGTRQMALIASGAVAPDGSGAGEDAQGVPLVAIRAFDDNGNASNFFNPAQHRLRAEQGCAGDEPELGLGHLERVSPDGAGLCAFKGHGDRGRGGKFADEEGDLPCRLCGRGRRERDGRRWDVVERIELR